VLIEYQKNKGHTLIVVFDGWKGGGMNEVSAKRGGVTVIYSRLAEKADAVIKRIITSDRREWIVVSSDREIACRAWATGSVPISADAFLPFLVRQMERDGDEGKTAVDSSYDVVEAHRKGNPHQLSKKERARRRVLAKL